MEFKFTKRAFAIAEKPKNFDINAPPVTGTDYLYRVRIETKNCPKVVVSNIDKTKFLDRQTITIDEGNGFISARPGFEPDSEWWEDQLQLFLKNRLRMSDGREFLKQKFPRKEVPKINKREDWCLYCLGIEKHCIIYREEPEASDDSTVLTPKRPNFNDHPNPPLLSVMLYLNQYRIIKLLTYHIDWVKEIGFSHCQGEWLYALLIALEKPLEPDTCSLIRSLSRQCSKLRNELPNADHEFLRPLNLILSIVAHYFDQKDMSDNFSSNN